MAKSQYRSNRKVSGSRYKDFRKKRTLELGGTSALTQLGSEKIKIKRVRGGNVKQAVLRSQYVYVNNKDKVEKLLIDGVSKNPANIHYTRRNIITKGAVVKTQKGDVKITSRPGQNGVLYGVFI
ncbi:MAG: 30S ribosomal protein S8e [Candidatus Nanoarchaeia archaeon]